MNSDRVNEIIVSVVVILIVVITLVTFFSLVFMAANAVFALQLQQCVDNPEIRNTVRCVELIKTMSDTQ